MQYIDLGDRDPDKALGAWLQHILTPEISEVRFQSGFFSADGLRPFVEVLGRLSQRNAPVRAVVGSNDSSTLEADVIILAQLLGLPRSEAKLGVVSFSGAFFHPKTYHFRRNDGSEAAYVGSANLSFAGVSGQHIEAGIILDSREGDPIGVIGEIAAKTDDWFVRDREGLNEIADPRQISDLTAGGILSVNPPVRIQPVAVSVGASTGKRTKPTLKALIHFPPLPMRTVERAGPVVAAPSAVAPPVTALLTPATSIVPHPSVPKSPPFPEYVLFDPAAVSPTSGAQALTGSTLPGNYVGVVFRLNQDSARHWQGRVGTANISIPVPTIPPLRFGIFQGRYQRPRAEFDFAVRYLHGNEQFVADIASTNVMVYGFAPGETGHGDVRMVVPVAPAREVRDFAQRSGLPVPMPGDFAFLEWPTTRDPTFRLTVMDRRSGYYAAASNLFEGAERSNQLVGLGACWLPPAVAPAW